MKRCKFVQALCNSAKHVMVIALVLNVSFTPAASVTMAFGEKIPPFCFPETNSGIELEIIGEALAFKGHKLVPKYFSFARVPVAFKQGKVDATMTDLGEDLTKAGGHYGNPAVFYYNVLITLAERNLVINSPADLKDLTVISFQGAINRFPDWLKSVKQAGNYFEKNDQTLQVRTLQNKRYDVVLSDRYIYKYFELKLKQEQGMEPKPVTEHQVLDLDPKDYRPVFRDPKIRDDFNLGLENLKQTGRLQAIYDKYIEE